MTSNSQETKTTATPCFADLVTAASAELHYSGPLLGSQHSGESLPEALAKRGRDVSRHAAKLPQLLQNCCKACQNFEATWQMTWASCRSGCLL